MAMYANELEPRVGKLELDAGNHCFALPRVLTHDNNGHPLQAPVPELAKLRNSPPQSVR